MSFESKNTNCDDEDENKCDQQTQNIIDTGIVATNAKHSIHCLTIIGQIEGHYILPPQNKTTKYEHIIPSLVAIEQDTSIEGLLIILNTVGGDVEAGLAISELIAGMKKPTVSIVVGGGHSIGVPLAVSAKRSFIVPSATMTIHPVRMNGLLLGIPQTFSYFDRMQERIVKFVSNNSSISPDQFRSLMMEKDELVMDVGSVVDGETAVKVGLINELGGLSEAIECLYSLIEEQNANKDTTNNKPQTSTKKPSTKTSANSKSTKKKQSHEQNKRVAHKSRSTTQPTKITASIATKHSSYSTNQAQEPTVVGENIIDGINYRDWGF